MIPSPVAGGASCTMSVEATDHRGWLGTAVAGRLEEIGLTAGQAPPSGGPHQVMG